MAATPPKLTEAEWLAWKKDCETTVNTLTAKVADLTSQNTVLLQLLTKSDDKPASRPKPCLPDPDKLSGQLQYDTFSPETAHKTLFLYVYGRFRFGTKLFYSSYSRLSLFI